MDWLSARRQATPNKTFLHIDGARYSFAAVDDLVAATCAVLQTRAGIAPGDKVALLLPNGLPFVLAALALLRLRALLAPLNTRLTASELAWQASQADCQLLLYQAETATAAQSLALDKLELSLEMLDRAAPAAPDCGSAPNLKEDCAIIFTSGTSGRPKAAVLTWGNIYHSALASAFRLGILPSDRWLCVLPLYHVGGLSIILRSLLYGTSVELLPFSVDAVNQALSTRPITLVSLVPTMLARLLAAKEGEWQAQLRLILLGGEAAPPALLARCAAANLPVAASYGLSEAASQVATALPAQLRQKPGSVGKPLLFSQLRINGADGAAAPANVAGEVLVKGPTVMRGYYKDASASAAALRAGWLHTGDIGYLDSDGDLFVLQRRADLIVSGGENIYPSEVENALRQHPSVAEALVFGLPDVDWGQRVAALIELRAGQSATAAELAAFARTQLAGYKIPRQIALVAALPRTAAGKIRRAAAQKAFADALQSQ